jgi:hypothetical protein
MHTVHLTTAVEAPAGVVFDVVTDWRQNRLWETELREYEPLTPEPFGVGTRLRWVREIRGRLISGEQLVTACAPPQLLVTEVPTGPMPMRTVTRIEPTDDPGRSTLHAELTLRPRGLLRLLGPLLKSDLHKRATANLNALRKLAEAEATARLADPRQ